MRTPMPAPPSSLMKTIPDASNAAWNTHQCRDVVCNAAVGTFDARIVAAPHQMLWTDTEGWAANAAERRAKAHAAYVDPALLR
jgi:hypothetical protein